MTRDEWKDFWDRVEELCKEYDCKLLLKFERGKDIALVIPQVDKPEEWEWPETCFIVEEARFGLRDGDNPTGTYLDMMRITKKFADNLGPSKPIHVQKDPSVVFSILYAP